MVVDDNFIGQMAEKISQRSMEGQTSWKRFLIQKRFVIEFFAGSKIKFLLTFEKTLSLA